MDGIEVFTFDCRVAEEDIPHLFLQYKKYDPYLDNLGANLLILESAYPMVHCCCLECGDEECTCGCECHEVYEFAIEYLHAIAMRDGWEHDEFERRVSDEDELFDRPLGPTSDCLTMIEVEGYVSPDMDMVMDKEQVFLIRKHLSECMKCVDNVELWEGFGE